MPDETQHEEVAEKLSSSKGHPLKTIKSSVKSLPVSKKIAVSSSVSSNNKDTGKKVTSSRKEHATRLSGHSVLETIADTSNPTASKRYPQSLIQGNISKLSFAFCKFTALQKCKCIPRFHRPSETI